MYSSFLKKFSKYTPTESHAQVLSKMSDYKLRIDKAQRLIDLVISFPEYVPYNVLSEICESIKTAHDAGGVKINPRYVEELFSIDKMADILSEFKARSTFGRGFFNGATAEFAAMASDNGEISIVNTADFDELASVVEDDSSIVIKLRSGGLGILTYAGCDEDISKIIYEWYGLSKKIVFSGKTTLEYDEFRSMNPVPVIHYNPYEAPREAPPVHGESGGGFGGGSYNSAGNAGGYGKYRQKVELPPDFVPKRNALSDDEPVCEVNYEEGYAVSGKMKFDISDPEPCHGIIKNFDITPIRNLDSESKKVTILGRVFYVEKKLLKSGEKYLLIFYITDNDASIVCKTIYNKDEDEDYSKIAEGGVYAMTGSCSVDTFDQSFPTVFKPTAFSKIGTIGRKDNAPEKRVELHLHTNMSAMDATADPKDIIKQVQKWGQGAVAITDHGNLQAFPQSMLAREKLGSDVKVIYGIESYFVDDNARAVYGEKDALFDGDEFVIFDLETTGTSPQNCAITEIGAVKYRNGEIYDEFCTFVNPEMPIPEKITEITGISDDMVKDAPTIGEVYDKFMEFCGDAVLVAHNASFDVSFLRAASEKLQRLLKVTYLDTVAVSRYVNNDLSRHTLDSVAKYFGLGDFNHHRASDDAKMLAMIFDKMAKKLIGEGITKISELSEVMSTGTDPKKLRTYHQIILVKNLIGLKNLYRLVSLSYLDYFYRYPRIPKTILSQYREGLIIGSACEAGELFSAIVAGKPHNELLEIASFYDYLEIQPLGNNMFLIENGDVKDVEALKDINRKIIAIGDELKKPVVATGDVHFQNPEDEIYRQVLLASKKMKDADKHIPLYMRTTEEMLAEFDYLGDRAYEVVVTNTRKIADMVEVIRPIPEGNYPPHMEGAEEELKNNCYTKAKEMYGEPLPEIVETRLERELSSIISNGFAPLYVIARRIIAFSEERGYQVGSRGSVGSSFAATMGGITEVNPLPPHYLCRKCKYSEFIADGTVGSGFDLPDKDCPVCGAPMYHDGHDIPFETFLGFNGDKSPDIDLNFSGDVQGLAHKHTEVLFGEGQVYRAGTLGTLAEKTAYGFVKKYCEEKGLTLNKAEETRLSKGCEGVKRTTGQHPGGIIVIPREYSVYDFTPVQHPADDPNADTITTHFAFSYLHDTILKLDLLGHDVPTKYRVMEKYTGLNSLDLPLFDKGVMELFISTKSLGVSPEEIGSEVGTFGLPEFGTKFVRGMIVESKPKNFSDLLQISGLSHGTDVWLGNAQELIRDGICTISEVVGTRDSIMVYLIYHGLDKSMSFKIMEDVRKGKGLKPEYEEAMLKEGIPDWYIASCKKIKYMFPKAHAAAYVMSALRLGWFKVYRPLEFYAAFFTVAPGGFEAGICMGGKKHVMDVMREIDEKGNEASPKEKDMYPTLQLMNEAYARGIKFLGVDLYKSDASAFLPEDGAIRLPFSSIAGLGDAAAASIIEAVRDGEFISRDDLRMRAGLSSGVMKLLEDNGVLAGMPETNQLTFF